jgi:DNA uptake protein ComE-like DNA-binding protein
VDSELVATRRELEEALQRAAAAERRALEIELGSGRVSEREREERFRELEGKLAEVEQFAEATSERVRQSDTGALVGGVPEETAEDFTPPPAPAVDEPEDVEPATSEVEPAGFERAAQAAQEQADAERTAVAAQAERIAAAMNAQRAAEEAQAAKELELFDQETAKPEPEPEPDLEPGAPDAPAPEGMLSLTHASFEELREIGMSVTQAKRVIRFREERDFRSVDDLDGLPGFPQAFLGEIKDRLVP